MKTRNLLLEFFVAQNNSETDSAKDWKRDRLTETRFFNSAPLYQPIIDLVKELFELLESANPQHFANDFKNWADKLNLIFTDLVNTDGTVKQELLDLGEDKIVPPNNADLLWSAFRGWVAEHCSFYYEKNLDKHKMLIPILANNKFILSNSFLFLTNECLMKLSYNHPKLVLLTNPEFNTDDWTYCSANWNELEEANLDNPNSHKEIVRQILEESATLINSGYTSEILRNALSYTKEITYNLRKTTPDTIQLTDHSTKLTELAAQLCVENSAEQSKICATTATKGRNLKLAGLLIGLAGLAIATVSITLAVATCGISTPLSLLGLHVGVSMIACGIASSFGAAGLALGGLGFFGSYLGHQKQKDAKEKLSQIEPRNQLSATLTQLADVAQQRVNPLTN